MKRANRPRIKQKHKHPEQGTLINMLREEFPGRFGFSVSHTTRKPRPGEVHGTHYYFSEKSDMQAEIDDNKFIEHANVHANLYGTRWVVAPQLPRKSFPACASPHP